MGAFRLDRAAARLCAAALLLLAVAGLGVAHAEPVRTERLEVELAPLTAAAVPGSTYWVAVRHRIAPGWHTYWRNAGDSGRPTLIAWTLPEGWRPGEIAWPRPERQRYFHFMNYGFSGEVLLPVPIQVPADARPGSSVRLNAVVDFTVCSDTLCVPEEARLSLDAPVAEGPAAPHPRFGAAVARALAEAPKPAGVRAAFVREGETLLLAVWGGPLAEADAAGAYFFPYAERLVVHAGVQAVERGPQGLTLTLPVRADADPGAAVEGVLALPGGGAWEIRAEPGAIPAQARGEGPAPDADAVAAASAARPHAGLGGLVLAGLLALLGGLVLNLMPCVFPILSMKAAALARSAHDPRAARLDGLFFLAGVLTTFLILAAALIAFKAAGQAAGWGFQLQSPWATGFLALLILAVGLNLSGVFEAGRTLQAAGGSAARGDGRWGAFLTGVLAVVVAAPCTAPFMAFALGYTLTAPPLETTVVFAMLGLGFALPFTALSLTPALLRRLPRPGPWMERLRNLLAFPMYGTAAWLAWVFSRQVEALGLAWLFAAALLLALALHLWGGTQRRVERGGLVERGLALLALAAALACGVAAASAPAPAARAGAEAPAAALPAEPWSPERVAELRAEGRPVLVNFTADWCVSCKVNERLALSSRAAAEALERTGTVYLIGDWTRRDDRIARELQAHGRSGVPLYLLYRPGEAAPQILPQLLTEGGVVAALEGR